MAAAWRERDSEAGERERERGGGHGIGSDLVAVRSMSSLLSPSLPPIKSWGPVGCARKNRRRRQRQKRRLSAGSNTFMARVDNAAWPIK